MLLAWAVPTRAAAQAASGDPGAREGTAPPSLSSAAASPPEAGVVEIAKFLAGGALGLGVHESGHVVLDVAFDGRPGVRRVSFGPLPFFAITHQRLSPRREYLVSSAGFFMQHLGSEVVLSRRPDLRAERAPVLKGLLAFNVLASMAYAGAAIAHAGPGERDTRAMAVFLGVDEAAVGSMLLAPAALDTLRYFRPGARWATWASRAAKLAMVLLVVKKGRG